jgi:F5/8 type C domain-containing protein
MLMQGTNATSNFSLIGPGKSIQLSPGIDLNKLEPKSEKFAVPDYNITIGNVIKGLGESILRMPYTVTVTFDSLTVHDDHDHAIILPGRSGDGEFDLAAFVQGKKVDLSNAVVDGDLWDVSEDETVYFVPGTEVTVDIPKTRSLSIMTFGAERDCGLSEFARRLTPRTDLDAIVPILDGPKSQQFDALQELQVQFSKEVEEYNKLGGCEYTVLGHINKVYQPPGQSYEPIGYGAGEHSNVVSNNGDFTLRYTISVTAPPEVVVVDEPDSGGCNTNLPATNATSSGNQNTFPPRNAIDNNINTKWWSTLIANPFITLDLGSVKPVCGVDIAWADGNLHPYRFNASVSANGNTFTKVLSGTSSGTTTSPEKYTFVETPARFVKIIITESQPGSPNSIAQISEIYAFGKGAGTFQASNITLNKSFGKGAGTFQASNITLNK